MSRITNSNKFDNKKLGIKKEINEEIGQLKNHRIHYTSSQNLKNTKSREKQNNLNQNQRINIRFEERNKYTPLNHKKSNTKIYYNNNKESSSLSKDKLSKKSSSKSRDKMKLIQTKVIKKRNIGQVERVVIDLINEDIDSIKTDQSNNYSALDSEKHNRYNEPNIYKNKDNNGTNSTNSINEKLMAINKIEGRWLNNSISNKEVNLSVVYNEIQRKKMQIEKMIKNWKKTNQIKKEVNINLIGKKNEFKNIKQNWNKDIKIIKGNNLTFIIDKVGEKKQEMNDLLLRWNKDLKDDNNIIISFEDLKDKTIFKYSEEKYLNDIISKVPFQENNNSNNIFYILNISTNQINSPKFNYKVINPKDKKELESLIKGFYNENKLNNNIKNSNNSLEQQFIINPLMILNEEQMSQLNEKINKNKIKDSVEFTVTDSKKETLFTISKQIAIDYEIIEQTQSNISRTDKLSDTRKIYQEFGQSTPLSMLYEKFLVFAVSRNIKYSTHSPQNNISYINESNKKKTIGFDLEKLMVNKFSLWVERIDKIESVISTDKKQ
jgi:hypothetical protein